MTSWRSQRRAPGKTTFALTLATELIARGIVDKLTVVCPTEHLKGQWASSAARFGIHIDPDFTNSQGVAGSHFDGVAVTYAQIGSNPAVHAARTRAYRTLVILDEIHHAGDSLSWGRRRARGLHGRDASPGADGYALPLGYLADPLRHIRGGRGRHSTLAR